jgi:hypothetical protein
VDDWNTASIRGVEKAYFVADHILEYRNGFGRHSVESIPAK